LLATLDAYSNLININENIGENQKGRNDREIATIDVVTEGKEHRCTPVVSEGMK
jgi:hypothetical protein